MGFLAIVGVGWDGPLGREFGKFTRAHLSKQCCCRYWRRVSIKRMNLVKIRF